MNQSNTISDGHLSEAQSLVSEIEVLTADECAAVSKTVHDLKFLWDEDRYRFGAGISYYQPRALYYATCKQTNPILVKHFDWVYDKLKASLSKFYNLDVQFRDDLAVPGFNIYCGPHDFSEINYNVHIDLQFMELNWEPKGSTDFGTTMSFTLPVAAPTHGAGLNIWNLTQADFPDDRLEESDLLAEEKAFYQRYKIGIAAIHDGRHYHQMKVAEKWLPTDERITLQGHGLVQNGKLIIYG